LAITTANHRLPELIRLQRVEELWQMIVDFAETAGVEGGVTAEYVSPILRQTLLVNVRMATAALTHCESHCRDLELGSNPDDHHLCSFLSIPVRWLGALTTMPGTEVPLGYAPWCVK
jgi:hypothetical protein